MPIKVINLNSGGGGGGPVTLTNGHIFVGNASNVATDVAMSGQAVIANSGSVTIANAAVIGKVLTGFTAGSGTVSATDSILQGFQKVVGNLALVTNPEIDHSNMGSTETMDFSQGPAHYGNISADCVVTLSNYLSGSVYSVLIEANGTNEVTWAGPTFEWGDDGEPDFSALSDGVLVLISFYYSGTKSLMISSYKIFA